MSKCSLSQCAQERESNLSLSCDFQRFIGEHGSDCQSLTQRTWVTLALVHNCVSAATPHSAACKANMRLLTSFYTRWSLRHADMEIQYTVLQVRLVWVAWVVWGMKMEIAIKNILLYLLLFRLGTSCSLTG